MPTFLTAPSLGIVPFKPPHTVNVLRLVLADASSAALPMEVILCRFRPNIPFSLRLIDIPQDTLARLHIPPRTSGASCGC